MTLTNLRSDARFYIFGDSTNTQFSDTDLDRYLNQAYREFIDIAIATNGDWQVNGTYATTDIVADQSIYTIDNTFLRINRIEFKTASENNYEIAKQVDIKGIDKALDQYKPDNPEFDLRDYKIKLFQSGDFEDITNGLKIYYQDDLTELEDAGDEPNIPEAFTQYLSKYAAIRYCESEEMFNKVNIFTRDLQNLRESIENYYANRSTALESKIKFNNIKYQ